MGESKKKLHSQTRSVASSDSAARADYGTRHAGARAPALLAPAALLPVAQCRHAHADHQGELALRLPKLDPHSLHDGRAKRERAGRLPGPSAHAARLSHTGRQRPDCRPFHGNSSRTMRLRIFTCAEVGSLSRSLRTRALSLKGQTLEPVRAKTRLSYRRAMRTGEAMVFGLCRLFDVPTSLVRHEVQAGWRPFRLSNLRQRVS